MMTEKSIKHPMRCETCKNNNCDLSNVSLEKAKKEFGRIMVMRCTTEIYGCVSHSAMAEHDKEVRDNLIRQILKWREDNRGKKVGYCTNGMIEDAFLIELMERDYWDPKEHDDAIAQKAIAEYEFCLKETRDHVLCFYENPEELQKFLQTAYEGRMVK